jgi:hypothetical protein
MRQTAIIAAAILSAFAVTTADAASIKGLAFGCITRGTTEQLTQFQIEKDTVAFGKLLQASGLTGDCIVLQPGTTVTVGDTSGYSGLTLACVRPRGETSCFWTLENGNIDY